MAITNFGSGKLERNCWGRALCGAREYWQANEKFNATIEIYRRLGGAQLWIDRVGPHAASISSHTDGPSARIVKIDSGGNVTVVADELPSSKAASGVSVAPPPQSAVEHLDHPAVTLAGHFGDTGATLDTQAKSLIPAETQGVACRTGRS